MSGKIVLVVLASVLVQALANPVFSNDKLMQCYERQCPENTTGCKKVVQTSSDKKLLITVISCLNTQDMSLKDYPNEVDNPFGPSVTYQSTSYSTTRILQRGVGDVVDVGNNEIDTVNTFQPNNNIEDFS